MAVNAFCRTTLHCLSAPLMGPVLNPEEQPCATPCCRLPPPGREAFSQKIRARARTHQIGITSLQHRFSCALTRCPTRTGSPSRNLRLGTLAAFTMLTSPLTRMTVANRGAGQGFSGPKASSVEWTSACNIRPNIINRRTVQRVFVALQRID